MKLTVLVDNNTLIDQYLLGEPAVSYYIECGDIHMLFDTGYSDVLIKNAESLGIDLSTLTHIICSHGHNDHTNGLKYLSQTMNLSNITLISHPQCFFPKRDRDDFIGSPYSTTEIERLCIYRPFAQPYAISDHFMFLGEIPPSNEFEKRKAIGKIMKMESWHNDYNVDDTALAYRGTEGIFIITGCSHSGICNIVEYAKKVLHEDRITGIIGGFHLFEDNMQLAKTIDYLGSCNIKCLYPCHCVSLKAKCRMSERLPLSEVGAGMQIDV